MQQHFNEVQKLVKLGDKLDACAKHFATQFNDATVMTLRRGPRAPTLPHTINE